MDVIITATISSLSAIVIGMVVYYMQRTTRRRDEEIDKARESKDKLIMSKLDENLNETKCLRAEIREDRTKNENAHKEFWMEINAHKEKTAERLAILEERTRGENNG